ncbi:MAG: hypothetical protein R3F60_24780 [bacterium]
MADPLTFSFRYAVFTVHVELDAERLSARTGLRTTLLPVPRLEHLWVKRERGADHEELLLTWRTARGRQRRVRIFADRGEPAFHGLVEALVAARPEIDRRDQPAGEAYRLAGARELEWVVLPAIMVVGLALVAFLLSPLLRHGMDGGFVEVPVERLGQGPPLPTRNVEVAALPLLDRASRGQAGADARLETASLWIPWCPRAPTPTPTCPSRRCWRSAACEGWIWTRWPASGGFAASCETWAGRGSPTRAGRPWRPGATPWPST